MPNMPVGAIFVMDNAPYHVLAEKIPTISSRKAEMIGWLTANNIPFGEDMIKPELYIIIQDRRPQEKKYEIDARLQQHGQTPVRLPPYHCGLNPFELIWANVKNYAAGHNTIWKMADVENHCKTALNCITAVAWQNAISHSQDLEEEY